MVRMLNVLSVPMRDEKTMLRQEQQVPFMSEDSAAVWNSLVFGEEAPRDNGCVGTELSGAVDSGCDWSTVDSDGAIESAGW